jgi:O-methyltransferase
MPCADPQQNHMCHDWSVKEYIRVEARKVAKFIRRPMHFPSYSPDVGRRIETLADDVRYASLALAIQRLETEGIEGAFAELGVYQGITSRFIHQQAPNRSLYLFDTFTGFPADALETADDNRFSDTSQEKVAELIADLQNVVFRAGYFPQTAVGLEQERFALVMLDFDLYRSAMDAFKFFYPRMVPGGYFFLHDFNSPESDHAISRAASEFLADKPELLVEIPDQWGSAVFRKTCQCQR